MMKRCLLVLSALLWAASASAQGDAINLSQAVVWNSPTDVASWPITTRIERLVMRPAGAPNEGLEFFFSRRTSWPNYVPPGWDGPLNYTVWAGVRINGTWHVSGIIQFWSARVSTGAPILDNRNFARNWCYDSRWGAMNGYQPVAGEAMIFFVTAGDARGHSGVTSVRERSNVVMVNLPANDSGTFTFASTRFTDLIVDQGAQGVGALVDAQAFSLVHQLNPELISAGDFDGNGIDDVAMDFGDSLGLWIRWNGTVWSQLHTLSPSVLAAGDADNNGRDELVVGFPNHGLWVFANGAGWIPLHVLTPTKVVAADLNGGGADLVVDFPGHGVWILYNNGEWAALEGRSPSLIAVANFDGAGGDDVALVFPSIGTWIWRHGIGWLPVHAGAPTRIAGGNIDGDGRAELILDFSGAGVWILKNLSAWAPLHTLPTRHLVMADLDGNGRNEIVVDFGPSYGVWVWVNDTNWVQASTASFEAIVPAELN